MRDFRFSLLLLFALTGMGGILIPEAAGQDSSALERIDKLEKTVEALMRQNAQLQAEIDALKREEQQPPPTVAEEASAAVPAPPESVPQPAEKTGAVSYSGNDIRVFWKDGLHFESGDQKTFKGKLGGRIQLDVAAYEADKELEEILDEDLAAGAEFRRIRLFTEGEYQASVPTSYKLQVDFAGEEVSIKDVYLGLEELPGIGGIKAGHFKEPFSLEELTSSKYITFLERSPVVETFAPSRNIGVMIGDAPFEKRMTWAVGGFTDADEMDDEDGAIDSDARVTARVTGLPFYEEDGRRLIHLGLSGSYIQPENDEARLRSRPGSHFAPRFIDTHNFDSSRICLLGAEFAGVYGPFSLQSEFIQSDVDVKYGPDAAFYGAYVYGSYFLTGESRPYKTSSGTFSRVKPRQNFSLQGGGCGAWEIGMRYSFVDLDDAAISGGELDEWAFGLNWYLNPNLRAMFDYGFAQLDEEGNRESAHIFQSRVQVDF